MTQRAVAAGVALLAIVLVAAQDAVPGLDAFHTWQYALVLGLASWPMVSYAVPALRGSDGAAGRGWGIAVCGALLVALAGLASGLLGPDTATVVRAPGTVAPLPDLGAAAFFGDADRATIEHGAASVTLRRPGHGDVVVAPGGRRFVGASIVMVKPHVAAFVDATDARGAHLTVTQPSGATFLSPILLFPQMQSIAGADHPLDAFAVPARGLAFKALYFAPQATTTLHLPPQDAGKPAILYAVFSDGGAERGITLAASDRTAPIAGIRLRAALGSYPELLIAAAPYPLALVAGMALVLAGVALALRQLRSA